MKVKNQPSNTFSLKSVIPKGMKYFHMVFCLVVVGFCQTSMAQTRYHIQDGDVSFVSDAKLEIIEAKTSNVIGLLDIDRKAFAVAIPISSFRGFNSSLQQEHFNENYMESSKYPKGIYKGVILDDIDLNKNGFYRVKTKGKLELHGVEVPRTIECDIKVENNEINVKTVFEVPLEDHNIKIPKIVQYKISEKIEISIDTNFLLKK